MPFIFLGLLLLLDNFRKHGRFVDPGDTDNHETWAVASIALGIGMLAGAKKTKG